MSRDRNRYGGGRGKEKCWPLRALYNRNRKSTYIGRWRSAIESIGIKCEIKVGKSRVTIRYCTTFIYFCLVREKSQVCSIRPISKKLLRVIQ